MNGKSPSLWSYQSGIFLRIVSAIGLILKARSGLLPFFLVPLIVAGCASVELYPPGPVTSKFNKSSCLSLTPPPEPVCSADKPLDDAITCASTTRDNYGVFLECRETRQLVAGATIGALAAGAAGVAAAGVSPAAAAALGASAGAGLALEYATYNKVKTKAYSDAIMQLQCVISKSEPLKGKLNALPDVTRDIVYLKNDENLRCWQAASPDNAELNLVIAKYDLAKQRETTARNRLLTLNQDVVEAVSTIDARAFAEAQSGVPDAAQIEQAVKSVSAAMPSTKAPTGAGAKVTLEKERPVCEVPLETVVNTTTMLTSGLNKAVADAQIPEKGFPDCLALKTHDDSGSSSSKSSSSSKGGSKGKSGSTAKSGQSASADDGGDSGGDDGGKASSASDATPQPKPDKIAFQVLPSDVVTIDPGKSVTLKLLGGKPPYHWTVVDGDLSVTAASQTDLFVTIEVRWSSDAGAHRLLASDQDGAEEVVTIKQNPPKPAPSAPGAPAHKPKPGHAGA